MVKQFGELEHPMFGQIGYPDEAVTSLSTVSHKVNSLRLKYNKIPRKKKKAMKKDGTYNTLRRKNCDVIGEIELIDTPNGNIAKTLFKDFPKGFSVRPMGLGNVNDDGVIENYKLLSCSIINKVDDSYKGIID